MSNDEINPNATDHEAEDRDAESHSAENHNAENHNAESHSAEDYNTEDVADESPGSEQMVIKVGDRVRLTVLPAYFKSADPMPMLRPPDVVSLHEEGHVIERRSGNLWSVRFKRGAFLVEQDSIEPIS